MDPTDMSLRELHWAVTARRRDEWDRTSQVLAFIAAHGGVKKAKAEDYHPYRKGSVESGRKGKVAGFFGAVRAGIAAKLKRQAAKE